MLVSGERILLSCGFMKGVIIPAWAFQQASLCALITWKKSLINKHEGVMPVSVRTQHVLSLLKQTPTSSCSLICLILALERLSLFASIKSTTALWIIRSLQSLQNFILPSQMDPKKHFYVFMRFTFPPFTFHSEIAAFGDCFLGLTALDTDKGKM